MIRFAVSGLSAIAGREMRSAMRIGLAASRSSAVAAREGRSVMPLERRLEVARVGGWAGRAS